MHSLNSSIAALEGELSTLNTSTNDEEINKQNSSRKSEISSQLAEKKEEKTKLENQKQELIIEKQNLEVNK